MKLTLRVYYVDFAKQFPRDMRAIPTESYYNNDISRRIANELYGWKNTKQLFKWINKYILLWMI